MDLRARAARGSDHDANLVAALELARDPAVVAYALFDAEADAALQRAGMPRSMPLRTGGNVPAFGPRVAPGPRGEARAPVGGSLTTDGESLVFAHLDASAVSTLAGRGLLDAHGMVGADGTTLYVSWIMKGASQGQGFAGFSLFAGDKHEPLFVGRTNFGTPSYACPVYGRGADRAQIVDRLVDADVARPGVQPLAVTEQPHLWVMKIEFRPGPDVVSVFVDPADSIEPAAANLVVDELEIKFDRLRLGSSDGVQWHFGRIILSNTFASAVR